MSSNVQVPRGRGQGWWSVCTKVGKKTEGMSQERKNPATVPRRKGFAGWDRIWEHGWATSGWKKRPRVLLGKQKSLSSFLGRDAQLGTWGLQKLCEDWNRNRFPIKYLRSSDWGGVGVGLAWGWSPTPLANILPYLPSELQFPCLWYRDTGVGWALALGEDKITFPSVWAQEPHNNVPKHGRPENRAQAPGCP